MLPKIQDTSNFPAWETRHLLDLLLPDYLVGGFPYAEHLQWNSQIEGRGGNDAAAGLVCCGPGLDPIRARPGAAVPALQGPVEQPQHQQTAARGRGSTRQSQ